MPIEVDEAELTRLRGAEKLMNDLLGSKDTKGEQHKLIKKLYPQHEVPFDPEATRKEATDIAQEKIDKFLKDQRDAKLEADFQTKINSYRLSKDNPNGYTEDGIKEITNLMRERTIPDFDAAVALFEKLHPAKSEPPSGYVPTGWNFGSRDSDDEDKKLLLSDPDAWADKEARKVWNEYQMGERS